MAPSGHCSFRFSSGRYCGTTDDHPIHHGQWSRGRRYAEPDHDYQGEPHDWSDWTHRCVVCHVVERSPAPLDADALMAAMDRVDMGSFWIQEPRGIHDPPTMQRMTFDTASYAGALAEAYNK